MTALALERLTDFAGVVPARGTYPIAAAAKIYKGSIVCLNAAGEAVKGGAGGSAVCVGKASATYDNTGGSAAAMDVEVEFGVFGWDSTTLDAGDVGAVAFVSDDQTVAATGTVKAGPITEVRDGQVFVWMGPHVSALMIDTTA